VDRLGITERPYDAFLVYGHARDRDLAAAIHTGLSRLTRHSTMRRLHVFRDEVNLAVTPSLWGAIRNAVDRSKYLIYIASPESAHSPWVARELEYWLAHRSTDQLLLVRTGGSIVWSTAANDFDWSQTTALTPVLRGRFVNEPLYVDLSWVATTGRVSLGDDRFRDAVSALGAALHGVDKHELTALDARYRQRRRRQLVLLLLSLLVATAVLLGLMMGGFAERDKTPGARGSSNNEMRETRPTQTTEPRR
jgi:hypothetical protein